MHTLNKLNTAKRKTVKNPSKANIQSVEKLQVEFSNSVELDRMLFVARASTNTLPDCFSLLNSLKTNTYPMVMSYNDDCLKPVPQITNAFENYFSRSFNHTEILAMVYESDDSFKLDDIFLSLNPSIIRETILDMKESPTITNDFLPPKLLKLCRDVFATLRRPVFCSIILTRSYPEV